MTPLAAGNGGQQHGADPQEVERFKVLYGAHLAATARGGSGSGSEEAEQAAEASARELEAFLARPSVAAQRNTFDDMAQQLRSSFHRQTELDRQSKLASLLRQLPPFAVSSPQDIARLRSRQARQKRLKNLESFCASYLRRQSIGVHPFFASLRRVLEAQSHDRSGRPLQWLLDDAVLMETGGDAFMQAAVWVLKAVLHFTEQSQSDDAGGRGGDPFRDDPAHPTAVPIRIWTLPAFLSNPECAALARVIPSYVLPRRGRASMPVYADGALLRLANDDDGESQLAPIELATGSLRYAPHSLRRDASYRGSWFQWFVECFWAFVQTPTR